MEEAWIRKSIQKDVLSPINIAIPFTFSVKQENSVPENPTTEEQFFMLRNIAYKSLSCTCKCVQSTAHSKGSVPTQNTLTGIWALTCLCQVTMKHLSSQPEMGFSVGFLVSAIDGKGIQRVLSFLLHHWWNKFKTWGGLGSSTKTSPWACTERRTGTGRTLEERSGPLACQVRLKPPPALWWCSLSGKMRQNTMTMTWYPKYNEKLEEINLDKNNASFRC